MVAPKRLPPWKVAVAVALLAAVGIALRLASGAPAMVPTPVPSPTVTPLPTPTSMPAITPTPALSPTPVATPTPARRSSPVPRPVTVPSPPGSPSPVVAAPTPVPAVTPTPLPPPAPAAGPGQLQIAARPWAEVVVDGRVIGTTPLDKITLEPGAHVVLLRHPAYEELRRSVVVKPGETVRLIVDLSKEASPKR